MFKLDKKKNYDNTFLFYALFDAQFLKNQKPCNIMRAQQNIDGIYY